MAIKFHKLLIPTDFSDHSLHALHYARDLAQVFEAQVHCIHVVDEALRYWAGIGPESVPLGPAVEDLTTMAEGRMQRFADEHLMGLHFSPVTKILFGQPYAEICRYAQENLVDLLVVATHGRGALAHFLLGSTTEKLIRNAPCPVLTVRPTGPAVAIAK